MEGFRITKIGLLNWCLVIYVIAVWIVEPLILWEGILKYNRILNDPTHINFPKDLNTTKLI